MQSYVNDVVMATLRGFDPAYCQRMAQGEGSGGREGWGGSRHSGLPRLTGRRDLRPSSRDAWDASPFEGAQRKSVCQADPVVRCCAPMTGGPLPRGLLRHAKR